MKYKVGDKVKVRTKEWLKETYGITLEGNIDNILSRYIIVSDMTKYCNTYVTIAYVDEIENYYKIEEDKGTWMWSDWMFEDMNNNTNTISNPNIVEDFAKLIGVELDEEFYDTNGGFRYKFTADSGLMVYDDIVEDWRVAFAYSLTAFFKMIKEGKFIKKWMPKSGDAVYFPSFYRDNLWNYKTYNSEDEHDKEMLKSGLYFKTQQEATECAKKIIKNMKEG